MMSIRFKIVTLGCKVNQYESAYLRQSLIRGGWMEAGRGEEADVLVVNTCIVTHEAYSQSRQVLGRAVRENPSARIVASGCYAEVYPQELSCMEGVSLVAGNSAKSRLPSILLGEESPDDSGASGCGSSNCASFERLPVEDFGERTRAFLKIQDGCESYCSYCIVPYARGPLRSLPPAEVIKALHSLTLRGYQEAVLTGIHLGKYGVDLSPATGLKALLGMLGKENLHARIRLSSLEPNEVDGELIGMISREDWICNHLHIPLQSGDDHILEAMKRRYRSGDFRSLIEAIHETLPLAAIGVDVMVGFPGEDEEAFENTRSLIRDLPISYLHVFPFSPRKGTPAAEFPGRIDPSLIRKRAQELRAIGQEKHMAFYRSCIGEEFNVLIEGAAPKGKGRLRGLTDNYLPVVIPFDNESQKNRLVRVRVTGIDGRGVTGTIVERLES